MENFTSLAKIQPPNKATMENKPIKVKYISNPMMVEANNQSEFRAIVQKLTGQHSSDDANSASFNAKDRRGLLSGNGCDPVGVGEVRDWRGEMECLFSGFEAPYIDAWRP